MTGVSVQAVGSPAVPGALAVPVETEDAPATPYAGWVIATVVLLVLGILLPVMFAGLSGRSFGEPALSLSMFVAIYAAVRLATLLLRGRDSLIQLTFWIYVYLWLGLAASAQVSANRFPIPFQAFDRSLQVKALVGVVIGIVAYDLGTLLGRRSKGSSWIGRSVERLEIAPRRVWVVAVAGIAYPLYSTLQTGLAVRFSSRATATNTIFKAQPAQRLDLLQNKASGLIQVALLWLPAFLALYLLTYLYRSTKLGGADLPGEWQWFASRRARRLLVVLVVVNILVNNPQSNPRARFAGVVIALVIAFFPTGRAARFRLGALGLLGLTIIVFPYAAVFRYDQRNLAFTSLSDQLSGSPDYGMFQQELNGLVYTDANGYTLGRQISGAILSPVPRVLWPSKPVDTGNLISRTELINASSDLWTEANIDFGFAGIAVLFLGYGYLSKIFDDAYDQRDRRRATVIGAAVPLFAAFQIFLVRGALQPAFGELAPVAVLLFLCLRFRTDATEEEPAMVHC